MEPDLKEQVIQLYDWQHGGTSFYCALYSLFQKADSQNQQNLRMGFPLHYMTLQKWNNAGDCGNDLFREYGLIQ